MKASKLSLYMIAVFSAANLSAQVYYSEDFENLSTETAPDAGWEFGQNESATEDGTEFVIAPPYAKADPASGETGAPGTSFSDENSVGFVNPPTVNGVQTIGKYLMSDSDKAGGSDNIGSEAEFWAITPSFSTEGSTSAWFHADAEIESNNNGEGVALLSVSIDQGETWTAIWQMVEPQRPIKGVGQDPQIPGSEITDGYPVVGSASTTKTWDGIHGRWHVALPAEANNQPDVRLRMGWYEPADAWWYAVDNIVVDNNLPPQGSEVVLLEEFEAGIPDTWGNSALGSIDKITWATGPRRDPGGLLWKEAGGDGVHIDILRQAELMRESGLDIPDDALKSLTLSDFEEFPDLELLHPNAVLDGRFVNMLAGGNYAMWQPLFEDDEASDLDSPSLDLSDATEVFLDFDSEMLHRNGSGMYEALVSVDGGSSFETIFTYQGALMNTGETAYFNHHYIPVPQAAGAGSVVFRFHAEGGDIDRFEGFWVVDNVRVTKNTANSVPVDPPSVPGLPPIVLPPIPGQQPGSITGIARAADGSVSIEYTGTLQAAETVDGPYAPVAGASSPYAVGADGIQFYIAR